MAALHLARYRRDPNLKQRGLFGSKPLALFMSEGVSLRLSGGTSNGSDTSCTREHSIKFHSLV